MRSALVLVSVALAASCSFPNLDEPECAEARTVVKQYYSLAIGGDPDNREDTRARIAELRATNFSAGDLAIGPNRSGYHFSLQEPTSHRVGECVLDNGGAQIDTTVIWKSEGDAKQRKDSVKVRPIDSVWKIERIDPGPAPGAEY